MTTLFSDIRYACRTSARQPLFTLVAVVILAIGIAGTATVFSIFNATCLQPLPIPHVKRVVYLEDWNSEGYAGAYSEFTRLREHNTTFEAMAAYHQRWGNLLVEGQPTEVSVMRSTPELFDILGIQAALGRCFTTAEDHPAAAGVVLLSHGFWQSFHKGDPAVLGQPLELDKRTYTVIGVLEADNEFAARQDLWIPLVENQGRYALNVIGRLQPGIRIQQAQQDLLRLNHRGSAKNTTDGRQLGVISAQAYHTGDLRYDMMLLLGAVGLVLLIACCNVSGLLLARGAYRSRELGIRVTLGARGTHIVQQVLIESLVLSVLAGAAGMLMSWWALDAQIPWLTWMVRSEESVALDGRYLVFSLGLVMGTTVLTGLLPALQMYREGHLQGILKSAGTWATASRWRSRSLNTIVIGEMALALTLLIGAGLLWRSFRKMQQVDPGFQADNILYYQINASRCRFEAGQQIYGFFQNHLEKVRTLPGVDHAALTYKVPLYGGGELTCHVVAERGRSVVPGHEPEVVWHPVSADYMATMCIRLLAGRNFIERDSHPGAERTVIVSQSLAKYFWPGEKAVGKRLQLTAKKAWYRVIGVAQDTRYRGLDQVIPMQLYLPYTAENGKSYMTVVMRTSNTKDTMQQPVTQFIKGEDPTMPVPGVSTLSYRIQRSLHSRHIDSLPYYTFGMVAGLLAIAGVYSVMAYSVSQRTQEFGVRLALGAQQHDIMRQVLHHGALLIGTGLCFGAAGAVIISKVLSSVIFGISPTDPIAYAGASTMFAVVALLACYLPARRAARIDPMAALRCE